MDDIIAINETIQESWTATYRTCWIWYEGIAIVGEWCSRSLAKAALATHHIRNELAVGGRNGEENQSIHKDSGPKRSSKGPILWRSLTEGSIKSFEKYYNNKDDLDRQVSAGRDKFRDWTSNPSRWTSIAGKSKKRISPWSLLKGGGGLRIHQCTYG